MSDPIARDLALCDPCIRPNLPVVSLRCLPIVHSRGNATVGSLATPGEALLEGRMALGVRLLELGAQLYQRTMFKLGAHAAAPGRRRLASPLSNRYSGAMSLRFPRPRPGGLPCSPTPPCANAANGHRRR